MESYPKMQVTFKASSGALIILDDEPEERAVLVPTIGEAVTCSWDVLEAVLEAELQRRQNQRQS